MSNGRPYLERQNRKSYDVISNVEHDDNIGAKRVIILGGTIGTIFGNNSATAQYVGKNVNLRCYNGNGAVQFIKVGNASVTVPSVTDGLAIPSYGVVYINTGDNEYFRTSSNDVQVIIS